MFGLSASVTPGSLLAKLDIRHVEVGQTSTFVPWPPPSIAPLTHGIWCRFAVATKTAIQATEFILLQFIEGGFEVVEDDCVG